MGDTRLPLSIHSANLLFALDETSLKLSSCLITTGFRKSRSCHLNRQMSIYDCIGEPRITVLGSCSLPWMMKDIACVIAFHSPDLSYCGPTHVFNFAESTVEMDSSTYGQGYASSCMKVCVLIHSGHEIVANLNAGMVLFYCTAVAMKRQDETGIAEGLEDFFDPGEKIEFAA
jgi:hypothetical protein